MMKFVTNDRARSPRLPDASGAILGQMLMGFMEFMIYMMGFMSSDGLYD